MALKADFIPYTLQFREPGGTSRGVMHIRKVWYLRIFDPQNPKCVGIGECAPLPGLSCDDMAGFERKLEEVCGDIEFWIRNQELLQAFPSIRFGLEMAWLDYRHGANRRWFPSEFTEGKAGIRINGLIWMGDMEQMDTRIRKKLRDGFSCLKLKIGAIDFEDEIALLKKLRQRFSARDLQLRVDANGAFSYEDAPRKLERLAEFDIHSIEQPIKAGNPEQMAVLCANTPLPIALDEELIGIHGMNDRTSLLRTIAPQYIILKPSLVGGFLASDEWIGIAEAAGVAWWATSALESNVGLNAIAQWTYARGVHLPQGLGTGQVFTNNVPSRLTLRGELLFLNPGRRCQSEEKFILKNKQ